jgi:hypothetical protein
MSSRWWGGCALELKGWQHTKIGVVGCAGALPRYLKQAADHCANIAFTVWRHGRRGFIVLGFWRVDGEVNDEAFEPHLSQGVLSC